MASLYFGEHQDNITCRKSLFYCTNEIENSIPTDKWAVIVSAIILLLYDSCNSLVFDFAIIYVIVFAQYIFPEPLIIIIGHIVECDNRHIRVINNSETLKGNLLTLLRERQIPKVLNVNIRKPVE